MLMNRRLSAPHISIVHKVIMQQCEVVEYLHSGCRTENALRIISIHIICGYKQCGAYTLASK